MLLNTNNNLLLFSLLAVLTCYLTEIDFFISLVLVNSCNWLHITYQVLNCPPLFAFTLWKYCLLKYNHESGNFQMASGVFLKS